MRRIGFCLALMAGMFGMLLLTDGVVEAQQKSQKPPSTTTPSQPPSSGSKFGSPGTSNPPASKPPEKPATPPSTPPSSKFGSPNSGPPSGSKPPEKKADPPKFGSPNAGPTPPTSPPGSSKKPGTNTNDEKAKTNREEASKRTYEEQTKATAPPKPSYKAPGGQEVKIDPKSPSVDAIRSRPSRDLDPVVRYDYTVKHVHHYHYSQPYSYYTSQPVFYVGGGYSSPFWYMMMEWDAQRRADWFYHNRYSIDQSAYDRGLQDGAVRARIAELERQNAVRNQGYVDSEFKDNPTLMYDQNYIESAYNPNVRAVNNVQPPASSGGGGGGWSILGWLCLGVVVVVGVIFLFNVLFVKRYGN